MKKNNPYRLRAYTLLELTIAMVITAICFGIGYRLVATFQRIWVTQQEQKLRDYSLNRSYKLLWNDLDRAGSVQGHADGFVLSDSIGDIHYTWQDSLLLREQYGLRLDTLPVVVSAWEVVEMEFAPDLVGQIRLEVRHGQQELGLSLSKTYSAEELLSLNRP